MFDEVAQARARKRLVGASDAEEHPTDARCRRLEPEERDAAPLRLLNGVVRGMRAGWALQHRGQCPHAPWMRGENASRGSAGSLLPDGDVLRALARERLPVPAAPA